MSKYAFCIVIGLISFLLLVPARIARGQCSFNQVAKLTADDAAAGDEFGICAASGDTAVVGAPRDDPDAGANAGSAYVFQRTNGVWQQVAHLTPDDAAAEDWFGSTVAIEGDTIVVGAPQHDAGAGLNSGAAYVFQSTNGVWTQVARLVADDATVGAQFGWGVEMSGGTIVVGAPYAQTGTTSAGAVYLFHEDAGTWQLVAKITSDDGASGDEFGRQSCLQAGTLVVGAYHNDAFDINSGAAYVFQQVSGAWQQVAKLTPNVALANDLFGASVSIDNSTIVVGALLYDVPVVGADAGAAFVFEQDGGNWVQTAMLTASSPYIAWLGSGVIIRSGAIFANTSLSPSNGSIGRVAVFRLINGAWQQTNWLAADDGQLGDLFALTAVTDDSLFFAAVRNDEHGDNSGAAYVFEFGAPAPDCNNNNIADDCEIAAGVAPDCNGNGVPDDCDIATATADDCNNNGVPDTCDIANREALDCNGNGIPDACDIANQTSCDRDANGIPDECDAESRLTTTAPSSQSQFGVSVTVSGDIAVIGDDGYHGADFLSGAAYIFRRIDGRWSQSALITQNIAQSSDRYGHSVSIEGDRAVVGAYTDSTVALQTGAAYVVEYIDGIWRQRAILVASDAATDDQFGQSVDISGDTIVVGAPRAGAPGTAYVFRFMNNAWVQIAALSNSDAQQSDEFGRSVSISGDHILVGASRNDAVPPNDETAHVYQEIAGAWEHVATLHGDPTEGNPRFGYAVAIDADVAVVGAPGFGNDDPCAAYVFRETAGVWNEESKLTSPFPSDGDHFGESVALDGDRIVVGAPRDDTMGYQRGAAFIYEYRSGAWQLAGMRFPTVDSDSVVFGASVALSGDSLCVGAPNDQSPPVSYGAVYAYDLANTVADCNANGIPDACEPPLGTIADFVDAVLNASGDSFDVCYFDGDDSGTLDGRDVAPFVARLLNP